jgi:hypothetical protein
MRVLLIITLAAILTGCSCLAPQQAALDESTLKADTTGLACSGNMPVSPRMDSKPAASNIDLEPKKAKTTIAAKVGYRPSANPAKKKVKITIVRKIEDPASAVKTKATITAKMEDLASGDPVVKKAKITIAGKMEDPASAQFIKMNRAVRKNTLGEPIDTICGYVKGKDLSGGDTGERPFIYIIKDNDAYIVTGSGDVTAAAAYSNICK